jgi:hypothetical protein
MGRVERGADEQVFVREPGRPGPSEGGAGIAAQPTPPVI